VRGLAAPLTLVSGRARRRPVSWLLPALGLALATAFAGAVAAEGTVAGDQSARSVLDSLSPLDRTVRVSWQGPVTSEVTREARQLLGSLGLGRETDVALLNPVRLSGIVVRPAAIAPIDRWIASPSVTRVRRCLPRDCPVLVAGSPPPRTLLTAAGVRLRIVASARLPSAAPLGFSVTGPTSLPPLLLTGDVPGLEALPGLSGIYRSHSWLAPLGIVGLRSWQLAAVERRLQQTQAGLLASGSQFSLTAPFDGLDQARAEAAAAPRRLFLVGGGALAVLALFVVIAAAGLRRDQRAELERLRLAGARLDQCAAFVAAESAWLSAVALIAGALAALAAAAVIASSAGSPVVGVLEHSLLTPAGALGLLAGWVGATGVLTLSTLVRSARVGDLLAVASVAALAIALVSGPPGDSTGSDPLPVLLAPLACLAAGVLTFRGAAVLLRGSERLARRGPVLARLALVGLARAPDGPALAIAFVAVSVGLGGFALAYRATLLRGTADQASNQVPLDAIVSPTADFATPLQLAPLSSWRVIAGGGVLPVRRTQATYASGSGTVTVPALGIPSSGLPLLRGWRSGDGSAPLRVLARRLRDPGPVRDPGAKLGPAVRWLSLRVSAPGMAVGVSADLRDPGGATTQLPLGSAGPVPTALRARMPPGRWELEALQLDEPTGLEITNGHQNAEDPAAARGYTAAVTLGPITEQTASGRELGAVPLGAWRTVGALRGRGVSLRFAATGEPGLLRPPQPSDFAPVPVLVDPQTAAAAARDGRLRLSVDELPLPARVVGVLRRVPTLPADAAGFVVADEQTLGSALDAQLPGQGQADELWISTSHPAALRAALRTGSLGQLGATFRSDVVHNLRGAPIAGAVLGTLVAASVTAGGLALLGLLIALLGSGRDQRVERDLEAQGMGPRSLRGELRARLLIAGAVGVAIGLALAVVLTRLAVAAVRSATATAAPRPPLVTVMPVAELAALGLIAALALAAAGRALR
jgi:hypothetical protein